MKYISIYRKLFKFQKKIQETERKNPRFCRNFQRRLYRSSSIQLLIINEILQLQLKRSREKKEILYFQKINEISQSGIAQRYQYPIIFSKLISKEYRYFLTRQIFNILWVFALSPILDNKKKNQIILTDLKGSQIYPTIYTFLKKPFIQYIAISKFSNFFNRKTKYWILSNLLIEKKFFLNWLKLDQRSTILGNNSLLFSLDLKNRNTSYEFTLQNKNDHQPTAGQQFWTPKKELNPLSLKITFETFVNLSFSDFLDACHSESTLLRRYNTFVRSSYYFPKYQNRQGLFDSTLINGLDCRFIDTSWSVMSCPTSFLSSLGTKVLSIFVCHQPYDWTNQLLIKVRADSSQSLTKARDIALQSRIARIARSENQNQSQPINHLKLFVQKLHQRIVFSDVILLPNLPSLRDSFKLRLTSCSSRSDKITSWYRFAMLVKVRDGSSIGSTKWTYKRLQIDSQKFSNLKTKLGRGPIRDVDKRCAMLHYFNNIDLKNESRKAINVITSSQKFSVRKDIFSSLFSTSKFIYFALIQKFGVHGVNPRSTQLALASSFQLNKKLQCSIHFFYKHLMEYNGLILLALKKKRDLRFSHNSLIYYAQTHGLKIKFIKFYSLYQGLHFLGWFFQKKNRSFEGIISHKNINNHQKELKHCLKTSKNKSIDKIIYELNQKIFCWQKFYNCSIQFSKTCSQIDQKSKLNDDLFWLIWRWIKKRHINRSSKWLYNHYWKKSTSRRWIFSSNQHTLIFYIR